MITSVGLEEDLCDLVRSLILLDYDALAAYEAAIERLKYGVAKDRLMEFRDDHERHTVELGAWLRANGDAPPSKGDMKAVLTQGKVVIGGLMGDRAILQAMRTNEDDTNTAYGRAVARDDMDADLAALVRKNMEDERRHCDWIQSYLKSTSGD